MNIEAELVVRTRAETEELFSCLEGLGDVKLMTGEAWYDCCDEVSDTTRARDGVGGTILRFPLTLDFPTVLVEVEADNERGKALGAGLEILERFNGVAGTGVALEEREPLGLTVVQPLASLVMDNARVLREVLVLEDVVRDIERRERVDVSEGVGMMAQAVKTGAKLVVD